MLQRSIIRSLRRCSSANSQITCTLCKCSCGRTFQPNGRKLEQKRSYEPRPNIQSPYAGQLEKKKEKELEQRRHYDGLVRLSTSQYLKCTVDNALEFMNVFAELAQTHRAKGRNIIGVQEEAMVRAMEEYQIQTMDGVHMAVMLLNDIKDEYVRLGKQMLYTLARCGSSTAVFWILNNAIVQSKTRPKVLNAPELMPMRQRLEYWAAGNLSPFPAHHHFVNLVLQGKILYTLGDQDGAIEMWERSIPGAVYASEAERPTGRRSDRDPGVEACFSPWVELTNAYLLKKDWRNARRVAEVGCRQDDPNSHYSMALLENARNEYGDHVATSAWLYHITKAAASGHVKAAHVLGNWYGSSGWKYIEDEPPDDMKPTPFDSYPPDADAQSSSTSFWDKFSRTINSRSSPDKAQQHQLFLTAAFPDTAYGRFVMALQWLEVSMAVFYAPSYLLAARLLLEKTLWPAAEAPKNALDLTDDRYTYASKADYEAGRPIEKRTSQAEQEIDELPNPGYDPVRAKDLIREVLYAVQALEYLKRRRAKLKSGRAKNSDIDEDYVFMGSQLDQWPMAIRKWFRFQEAREMYMDDQRGVLYDDELKLDLGVTAKQICDEWGWDIYDEEGGLMYRCVRVL